MNIISLDFAQIHFEKEHAPSSPKISKAIEELIAAKKLTGRRDKYLKGLRSYLALFAKHREDIPVARFSQDDIESVT